MLLLDMAQYKVVKGKRLGSVLVKQFSLAQPGWGLGRGKAHPQNIIRLRCIRCGVSLHPISHGRFSIFSRPVKYTSFPRFPLSISISIQVMINN